MEIENIDSISFLDIRSLQSVGAPLFAEHDVAGCCFAPRRSRFVALQRSHWAFLQLSLWAAPTAALRLSTATRARNATLLSLSTTTTASFRLWH